MITSVALNMVVYNVAHRLYETLARAAPLVDEMVVVDQSSTDGSADIARDMGATVLIDVHHGYCEPSRQMAMDATQSEWVLVLDADEHCTEEFAAEMRSLDKHPQLRVRVAGLVNGETFAVSQPIYRFFRRCDFYCKPTLHSCPLPGEVLTQSMGLWVVPYIAIWDTKTWTELLANLERYERLGRTDVEWLYTARRVGVTGPELDTMSREERHALGFHPPEFPPSLAHLIPAEVR